MKTITLSEKAERMFDRIRSMSDEEMRGYIDTICIMPHLKRVHGYWLEKFTKTKERRAFVMALFAYEDNRAYGWLRDGGIYDVDIAHNPAAYRKHEVVPVLKISLGL